MLKCIEDKIMYLGPQVDQRWKKQGYLQLLRTLAIIIIIIIIKKQMKTKEIISQMFSLDVAFLSTYQVLPKDLG